MKRFTETLKWAKPWFRQLTPKHKLLWQWMCDNCDNAGVLDPDWGLASFQIGFNVGPEDAAVFNERVTSLRCGKVWIPSFIEFQVTNLSRDCKAHGPIFTSLEKHGIDPDSLSVIDLPNRVSHRVSHRVCNTLKEKEKEIEEEKEQETDAPKNQKTKRQAKASTPEEVEEFALSVGCAPGQGTATFWKWEGNGWMNGKAPIKDWKSTIRSWLANDYLEKAPVQREPVYQQSETANMPWEDFMRLTWDGDEDELEYAIRVRKELSANLPTV